MRKGQKASPEARAKMSAARKGIARTTGYKFTEEQKQKLRDARRKYMAENPEKFAADMKKAHDAIKKRPIEETEKINYSRAAMKRMNRRILTMARKRKDCRTEDLVGYSKEEFIKHIESTFHGNMCWEDRSTFHIDHIIPFAAFYKKGITDPFFINALCNLRALSPEENMKKSDNYDMNNFDNDFACLVNYLQPGTERKVFTINEHGTFAGIRL